jgi:hypothetical protein
VAGAVARRSKVATGLPVVIADRPAALPRAPEPGGRFTLRRISAVFISRLPCRLGTFGLLRRRGLALHLLLCILRGRCNVSSCPIHRAGRRVLIDVRTSTNRLLAGMTRCRSGTCVLQVSAGGVAGASLCGADTQNHNGAARENESFRVHLLLPGFRPEAYQDQRETDLCAASSGWNGKSRYSSISDCLFAPELKALRGHP